MSQQKHSRSVHGRQRRNTEQLNVEVPSDLFRLIQREAERNRMTKREVVIAALAFYVGFEMSKTSTE